MTGARVVPVASGDCKGRRGLGRNAETGTCVSVDGGGGAATGCGNKHVHQSFIPLQPDAYPSQGETPRHNENTRVSLKGGITSVCSCMYVCMCVCVCVRVCVLAWSLDLDQLDVEDECRVGRNDTFNAVLAVRKIGGARQDGSLALAHLAQRTRGLRNSVNSLPNPECTTAAGHFERTGSTIHQRIERGCATLRDAEKDTDS